MEKIYMDSDSKSSKKQSFIKKLLNDRGSMTALVVIAFVGIIGLMVFGLNQISFAADTNQGLGESFISAQGEETMMKLIGETNDGKDGILPILGFYTKDGIPIFCIEYDVTYVVDKTYTPGEEISDLGLIYLMANLYPNVSFKDASGNELSENIQMWLTQSAIWTYLYETGDPNNQTLNSTPTLAPKNYADNVRKVVSLYREGVTGSEYVLRETTPLYDLYGINTLIAKAKEVKNQVMGVTVNKKSENISVTNDNKYYQTDLISVVGNVGAPEISSFEGYSVNLSKAPEGTILVDESGNQYSDLDNMAPTAKFFVRVPVEKVTDANKSLEISVSGKFKTYGANKYVSNEYQKVANVKLLNKNINSPLTIQLDYTPDVPDTGMGVAQTIYFMGLILLLSGVGIVYANANPKTNE